MNKEQISGKVDQIKGRIKQGVGESVNDQQMANEGVVDQVKGAAKETWGNVKDTAAGAADIHKRHAEEHADEARAKVRNATEDTKDRINRTLEEEKARQKNTA